MNPTRKPGSDKLPVSIIGGYLGAGKTTFVNHLLRHSGGLRLAVLVNDFGDISIDADLIDSVDDQVLNLAGGCVCCSIGSDLVSTLGEIGERFADFDHILLETSGVAMPGIVAATVSLAPGVRRDAVIVICDAINGPQWLTDTYIGDTLSRQIAAADLIIVSKEESVTATAAQSFRQSILAIAPDVPMLSSGALPAAPTVLGSMPRAIPHQRATRSFSTGRIGALNNHQAGLSEGSAKLYFSDTLHARRPVDPQRVAELVGRPDSDLLRVKGILRDPDGNCWLLQRAGRRTELRRHPASLDENSRLVMIGIGESRCTSELGQALRAMGFLYGDTPLIIN